MKKTSCSCSISADGLTSFRVRAVEANGLKVVFSQTDCTGPLKTAVTGIKRTVDGIKLTWKAAPGATHYRVLRGTTSKESSMKVIKVVTGTSFTDTGVKTGTKYYYRIRPIVKDGDSAVFSGKASAYKCMLAVKAPAKPTLTQSGSSVKAAWKKVAGATGYEVRYAADSTFKNCKKVLLTSNPDAPAKVLKDLPAGDRLYVGVRSYKTVDGVKKFSPWCTKASIKDKLNMYVPTRGCRPA